MEHLACVARRDAARAPQRPRIVMLLLPAVGSLLARAGEVSDGFFAHWVRVEVNKDCNATAYFMYN